MVCSYIMSLVNEYNGDLPLKISAQLIVCCPSTINNGE